MEPDWNKPTIKKYLGGQLGKSEYQLGFTRYKGASVNFDRCDNSLIAM